MAYPVVESTSTNTATNDFQVVVTAPTGINSGDLLVAYFISFDTSDDSNLTPSGWTKVISADGAGDGEFSVYTRVADSSDESATDYTFSVDGTSIAIAAAILRISGAAPGQEVQDSQGVFDSNGGTSFSETVSVSSIAVDHLVLLGFGVSDLSSALVTVSDYATTPSKSFSELLDFGVKDGANDGVSIGVASATDSTDVSYTNISCTFSAADRGSFGTILIINAQQDASADISHLATMPTVESVTGSNTANADIPHLAITPTVESLTAKSSSDRTQWTNKDKPDTDWTNKEI